MPDAPDLARLYDAHAPALFGVLLQLTRDEGDTRDLLQDIFVKLARRPGLLDGVENPRAFLLRLAHNAALDLFRRRGAHGRRVEALATGGASPFARTGEPDESAFRTELADALAELGYPLNAVSVRLLGQFEGLAKRIAQAQAYQNMVIIACALERWSLAHGGGYPDSTSALVPEFLAKLPIDPVNGQPLRYRRTDDGRYRLWSVGANLKDEDGTPGIDVVGPKDTRRISNDPNKGDWVWSYQKL